MAGKFLSRIGLGEPVPSSSGSMLADVGIPTFAGPPPPPAPFVGVPPPAPAPAAQGGPFFPPMPPPTSRGVLAQTPNETAGMKALEEMASDDAAQAHLRNIDREYDPKVVAAARKVYGAPGQAPPAPPPPAVDPGADQGAAPAAPPTAASQMASAMRVVAGGHDANRNPWRQAGQAAYADAQGRKGEAVQELGDIAAGDQLRQAAQTEQLASDLKVHDDAARLAEATRAKEAETREVKLNSALDEVRQAKIDPLQSTRDLGVGGALVAVVGAALGGYAQAANGGSNAVLGQLNSMAQASIDAQKAAIDNKKAGIQGQMGLLGQMRQRFGDERQAEIAARIAIREGAALKGEQMAEASGSMKAVANAKLLRADIDAANALERRALIDVPEFVPPHVAGGAVAGQVADVKDDQIIRGLHGEHIVATSKEGAEKVNNRIAFENTIGQLQDRAAAVFKANGRKALVPGTEGYHQLAQIREEAIPAQSLATGQGVVREFERDPTLKGLGLGGYSILSPQDPANDLANARKTLHVGSQEFLKQYGGQQVRPVDVAGPDGKVRRVYQYVAPNAPQGGAAVKVTPVGAGK